MATHYLLCIVIALMLSPSFGKIFWKNCDAEADLGGNDKRGLFYNKCIKDHIFTSERHSWQFIESTLRDTEFNACTFVNTNSHSVNFTLASLSRVTFTNCLFGSSVPGKIPMRIERTTLQSVTFEGCTFDKSAALLFSNFRMSNVTFSGCIFESDTTFELAEMEDVKFKKCKFQRSVNAKVGSPGRVILFEKITANRLSISDSVFLAPLVLSSVFGADLHFNGTTFADFWCHSRPQGTRKILTSSFNDSMFSKVTFKQKMNCDLTTWRSFTMLDSKFMSDAIFSKSNIQDIYWDNVLVSGKNFKGSCTTLDLSESTVFRKMFANVSAECELDLRKSKIEIVHFKNIRAKYVKLQDTLFRAQERVDGQCCVSVCQNQKCKCDYKRPPKQSDRCPEAAYPVDQNAPKGRCFPARASVRTEGGHSVAMSDLKHGARIAVGAGQHSDVYFFGHRSRTVKAEFVSISHSGASSPLLISPGHYLYVNGRLSTAESVRSGDLLNDAEGYQIFVTAVNRVQEVGLFAPASVHGDLIVNGVRVSSYTSVLHPTLSHWLLSPLRLAYSAGLQRAVERFTIMHERGFENVARALWLPEGPKSVEV